jgi:hypothetical protein
MLCGVVCRLVWVKSKEYLCLGGKRPLSCFPIRYHTTESKEIEKQRWNDIQLFKYHHHMPVRWADQDCYGHVNNKEYYSYVDTAVNSYLIHEGGLDIFAVEGPRGYVVRSECSFYNPISFTDKIIV